MVFLFLFRFGHTSIHIFNKWKWIITERSVIVLFIDSLAVVLFVLLVLFVLAIIVSDNIDDIFAIFGCLFRPFGDLETNIEHHLCQFNSSTLFSQINSFLKHSTINSILQIVVEINRYVIERLMISSILMFGSDNDSGTGIIWI